MDLFQRDENLGTTQGKHVSATIHVFTKKAFWFGATNQSDVYEKPK